MNLEPFRKGFVPPIQGMMESIIAKNMYSVQILFEKGVSGWL